jgi:hypothetical protein
MRLGLSCFALAVLAWCSAAGADPAGDIETLEATASDHVASFSALDTERTNLALQYRASVEELAQRLKFGTVPKNPALLTALGQARAALAALANTGEALATISAELTDDAAAANALARGVRAALAASGADAAGLAPLAARIAAASDTIDRALGQALEQRRRQAAMLETETQDLANLSRAIDAGHLSAAGTADPTLAEMLAPPSLMSPPGSEPPPERAPAEPGRWAIEFGVFQTEDDATFTMARLSIRGTQSRYVTSRDKRGHAVFKVLTRAYPTRAAAEAAAADLRRHDLHPSGVVEVGP